MPALRAQRSPPTSAMLLGHDLALLDRVLDDDELSARVESTTLRRRVKPVQILPNNLLYDISEIAIALDEVDEKHVTAPHPRDMAFAHRLIPVLLWSTRCSIS